MLLTHEETLELIAKARSGDRAAKETLVERNAGLARSIAMKFQNRGVEYEDLMQLALLGLYKAVMNFDPSFNVRFSTYAVPMIAGEIKRFLRDDGMVKVSRGLKERAAAVAAAGERIKRETGREAHILELARETGLTAEEIAEASDAVRTPVSLNELLYDDGKKTELMDVLPTSPGESEREFDRLLLSELLAMLGEKEKRLLEMRFFRDRTQSEIAAELGVSQVQVSRLISRTIRKLRERMGESI